MKDKIQILKWMYSNVSKHSNYQILASDLEKYLIDRDIIINSRNEKERLDYFLKNVNIKNKQILDIGGNTGYFTFEFLKRGVRSVDYYEGNIEHAKFVELASNILGYDKKLFIFPEYYEFNKKKKYDIVLLLNVLHHLGDDFGNHKLARIEVLDNIIKILKELSYIADTLIFQLGFNWKGNINNPFFKECQY